MRGLVYLLLTGYKNAIKNMFKNPAKLLLVIFIIAMLVLVIFTGGQNAPEGRDSAELFAMILALYTTLFVLTAKNGFLTGASFYSMADVNILFSVPMSSKRILLYGLLKQAVSSLLLGLFLLFQYSWLHNLYGVMLYFIIAILLCYCGVIFCAQVTAMAIYAFTSGNEKRKTTVRMIFYGFYGALLLYLAIIIFSVGVSLETVVTAINAPLLRYLPISGWLTTVTAGFYELDAWLVLMGLGGVVGYLVLFVFVLMNMRADFYEDVLLATELSFNAISGAKEGKIPEASVTNVKVGKTGINKGWGAAAFYHKHRLENRRARVFLVDRVTWTWVIACIGFAFFVRENGIMPIFVFTVYMQIFSVAMGRWLRELMVPYVYLLPEKPFKKLYMICGEQFYKLIMEALLIFIPVGLIVDVPVWDIAGAVLGRFSFGVLFMAGNILMERVFGHIQSKVLTVPLYFILLILLSAPGIVAGFFLSTVLPAAFGMAAVFILITVWNLLISMFIIFLCRNVLQNAELSAR